MSFEQTASGEWHFPSPNATPHTNRFSFPSNQSPPAFPGYSPLNPQGSWGPAPSGPTTHHGTNAGKSSLDNVQGSDRWATQQIQPARKLQSQGNYSSHVGSANPSFVTTSFVQQFGDTNIHGSSQQEGGFVSDQPESQMQTPPPTRHTDAKRKPQQPAIDFTTPSTIVSRRMSTPHEWQNQNQPALQTGSPFHLSPLQYFNTGPLTAPVQSQPNFWDSNAFYSSPTDSNPMQQSSTFWSSPPAYQPIVPSNMPPSTQSHRSSNIIGPQTTLLSQPTSSASLQAPPVLLQSHVDPSLISKPDPFSAGPISSNSDGIFSALSVGHKQSEPGALDVPKRDERVRKNVRVNSFHSAPVRPSATLRRSVTDSRPKRSTSNSNRLSLVSADLQELTHDLQNAQILRKHSPLKRQRSNTQTSSGSVKRKSVILKIDENGYASTEVQMMDGESRGRGLEHMLVAGNDESDSEGDLPESTTHSRTSSAVGFLESDGKPTSSAQDALREMMQGRKKVAPRSKALDTAMMPPPTRNLPPELSIDTALRSSASPTTISDPGMLTIDHLTANTRCICKNSKQSLQQQPMIQCGSCLNWLHTSCVGLNPLALPTAYLCNYCTSSSSTARTRRR